MNSKAFLCLFILILPITGCISEFNANLPTNDEQILIVEGNVVGNTEVIFYLSKSFPLNTLAIPEECFNINANLTIIGSNGYKSPPAIYLGKGAYRISMGEPDDNVEYGLQIEYEGDIYQSALSKPLHTPEIDSVSWKQPEEAGTIYFHVSTHENTKGAKYYMWNYAENWEVTANNRTTIFFNTVDSTFYNDFSAPYYYCWKSDVSSRLLVGSTEALSENRIINRQLFTGDPKNDRFSVLYSVIVYQIAIGKNAFDYYRNKIVLNEEMGGLFTPQPAELRGNITCITEPSKKAMGYVEVVKNTTQKRIFIDRSEITRPRIPYNCEPISNDSVLQFLTLYKGTYIDYYRMGYRPSGSSDPSHYYEVLPEAWAPWSCTECTGGNGSKNKPDFWPNDHK